MPVAYRVKIKSISTDGTNLYLEIEIFNGLHTLPTLRPSFPVGTAASDITSYIQTIANNQPVLDQAIADLVNTEVISA